MSDERKTIMIVDDNTAVLEMSREILKDKYKVYPAPSAEIMLDLLDNITPDLILLDIEMPKMNGYEALKVLKSTPRWESIPVIILTARADEDSEYKGLDLGAVDYVTKPFPESLLRKRIDNQLIAESQRRKLEAFNADLSEVIRQKAESLTNLQGVLLTTMTDMVEFRDDATGGHVNRTQRYTELLLEEMVEEGTYADEISTWDIPGFASSTTLHDVGKIAISDAILNKPGKLTDEEFEIMKTHVTAGVQIIKKVLARTEECSFLQYARQVVGAHHERWDGMGYPAGLKGADIPLGGRLMAIADVYDALVSKRAYKMPCSTDEARAIIEKAGGTQFDPALIHIFSRVADRFAEVVRQGAY